MAVVEFRSHRIMALVRASNGHEAYLAIVAEGIPDPQVIALLLDCVRLGAGDDRVGDLVERHTENPGGLLRDRRCSAWSGAQ
ncbi:hypothetical protein D0Z08_18410 [Nocardioides immobilis]|uniref:Uncharacterized protein n=1 Tax=Nocardioides immobilis TaxID=2049295 RepID=A0A417XZE6_9ACTN|nr:hypothetical protein [Nocardioides immobilis]RHW25743.1 hypothetical protein D0Z08_18410 [Nocardioides immobilis]